MKIILLSLALITTLALATVGANAHGGQGGNGDDDDGSRSNRCAWNSDDFQRRNYVQISGHAVERVPLPSRNAIWDQHVYYFIQLEDDHWSCELYDYHFYQYNYWKQETCEFRYEQFDFTVKADGTLAIIYSEWASEPRETTYRGRNRRPSNEGFQEYEVSTVTPVPFSSAVPANAKCLQAALGNNTLAYTFVDKVTGKVTNTDAIDIRVHNQDRDYSLMIYYPEPSVAWVEIDSEAKPTPPVIAAAMQALAAGQFTLQPDPLAVASGFPGYLVYMWDIPHTRDLLEFDRQSIVDSYRAIFAKIVQQ